MCLYVAALYLAFCGCKVLAFGRSRRYGPGLCEERDAINNIGQNWLPYCLATATHFKD